MSELLLHSFETTEYISNYVIYQGYDKFKFEIYQIDYSKYIQIRVTREQTVNPGIPYSCDLSYILSLNPITGITSRISFKLKDNGDTKVLTLNNNDMIDASGFVYLDIEFRGNKLFTQNQGGGIPEDLNVSGNLKIPIICPMVFKLKNTINNKIFQECYGFFNLKTYNYISFNFDPLPSPPIGYSFKNWNHAEKGIISGWNQETYKKLYINVDISYVTLEPIFTPNTYTVSYNGNGATSGSMASQTATYGEEFITNKCDFIKTGYRFIGWKDNNGTIWSLNSSGVYESGKYWVWSGAEYTKNITLQAQWKPYELTINYIRASKNEDTSPEPNKENIIYSKKYKYNDSSFKLYTPKKSDNDELWILRLGYTPKTGAEWIEKDTKITASISESYSPGGLANKLKKSIDRNNNTANLIVNWEVYGLVNIYTNEGWKKAVPYIYTNSKKWERAVPYIYYNNKWNMGG